jgi:hypothetical protein
MRNPIAPTWTITGKIELRDMDKNLVNDPRLFDHVCVSVKPSIFTSSHGDIHFKIPGTVEGKVPQRIITIDVTGFGRGNINLTNIENEDSNKVEINYDDKVIDYKKPISIIALNPLGQNEYKESSHLISR